MRRQNLNIFIVWRYEQTNSEQNYSLEIYMRRRNLNRVIVWRSEQTKSKQNYTYYTLHIDYSDTDQIDLIDFIFIFMSENCPNSAKKFKYIKSYYFNHLFIYVVAAVYCRVFYVLHSKARFFVFYVPTLFNLLNLS